MPKYTVIWEFEVKPDKLTEFEEIYNSQGVWAQLFQKSRGFIQTELVQNIEASNRYIVMDHWQSRADYLAFREAYNEAYENIDADCRASIIKERLLGAFETVENRNPKKASRPMGNGFPQLDPI
jgi:heme-degrading monooxygenase HmoA